MAGLRDLTAVILAGGLGTRLRTVLADRPKVLGKVGGRPFLTYLLDQLAAAGLKRVVLCTGYLGDQVRKVFGESYGPLQLVYSQERAPLGTGGALGKALPLLESDSVLIMNGDSYCDVNLQDFLVYHDAKNAGATIVLVEVSDSSRFGGVTMDGDGAIVSFEEKNDSGGLGAINAGIYLVKRPLIETISKQGAVSLEREIFPAWVGKRFYGYRCRCRFLDIGTPESYVLADKFFDQDIVE
ncbi:MAG: nucleotidyltransferase family protein [Candidatus Zixiibacteriota bacterium]